jgi:hypothetical protein
MDSKPRANLESVFILLNMFREIFYEAAAVNLEKEKGVQY